MPHEILVCLLGSGTTGRNGGHMQEWGWAKAHEHLPVYGPAENLKSIELERHTVREVLKLICEHQLEEAVELQSGGRLHVFYSQEELDSFEHTIKVSAELGASGEGGYERFSLFISA
jgi:hypothetical protein